MTEGPLSPAEKQAWELIVRHFGDSAVRGSRFDFLTRVARVLFGWDKSQGDRDSSNGQGRRRYVAVLAGGLMVAAACGVAGAMQEVGHDSMGPPVAFAELSETDQLAVKRAMLTSGLLLNMTSTCGPELNAAADGARGSLPSSEELRAAADLASESGAPCLPDPAVGSGLAIQVNGLLVWVDGNTLPGEHNNVENLCSPLRRSGLEERVRALPLGSVEQQNMNVLLSIVQADCLPKANQLG